MLSIKLFKGLVSNTMHQEIEGRARIERFFHFFAFNNGQRVAKILEELSYPLYWNFPLSIPPNRGTFQKKPSISQISALI